MKAQKIKSTSAVAAVVVLSAGLLAACGSTSAPVRYDMANGFHAAKYAQYHLLNHPVATSSELEPLFADAVHRALGNKGYRSVDKSQAAAYVSVKLLLSADSTPQAAAGLTRFDQVSPGVNAVAYADAPRDKTLLVLVQDARTHQVVWAGWSQMQVDKREVKQVAAKKVLEILSRVPRISRGA